VYAQPGKRNADVNPQKEEGGFPTEPEASYGWEKLFAEEHRRNYFQDYEFDTRILKSEV
jgi:nucleoside-diphosphate-sugar epimerase